jgi:hypothetical protein
VSGAPDTAGSASPGALPLFPLQSVLFPGGRLALKVFEARYLDMVSDCLRRGTGFGVVCLTRGGEVRRASGEVRFESTGVVARIDEVDAEQPGVLRLACRGTHRFRLAAAAEQRPDGLWVAAQPQWLPDDAPTPPAPAVQPAVQALAQAIERLAAQGATPFVEPYRLDDAGWVANRWCEILPIPLGAKQKLMELDDPALRLQLVHEFLAAKGVVSG